MGCKEQLLWSLEPPSWTVVPSLVSHFVVLPPPISLLCYLPFLECVSSAAPLIPQRHHQVPRWAELWCTESAAEVAGSGCDRHWAAPGLSLQRFLLQPHHHQDPAT